MPEQAQYFDEGRHAGYGKPEKNIRVPLSEIIGYELANPNPEVSADMGYTKLRYFDENHNIKELYFAKELRYVTHTYTGMLIIGHINAYKAVNGQPYLERLSKDYDEEK